MHSDPTSSIDTLVQQAHELIAAERFDDAERMLLDLVKGNDLKSNLVCYDALSAFSESRGKVDDSVRYALQGLAAAKAVHGEESDQVVSHMERVAALYEESGRFEEANDLIYRAQIIKERLVFSDAEPEPEIGSAEEPPVNDNLYLGQSSVFTKPRKQGSDKTDSESADSATRKPKSDDSDGREPDEQKLIFAEDEPREHRPGWLMEEIQKKRATSSQDKADTVTPTNPPSTKSKGETTGAHRFRMEDAKEPDSNGYKGKVRVIKNDANAPQRESMTNAPRARRDLEITDSGLKAVVDTTDQLTRTLQMGSIRWSVKQFVQRKVNIYAAVGAVVAIFFIVLVYAYMQPRKTNPLDVYMGMPHNYRTITGDVKIKLASDQAAVLDQGDSSTEISTSYVVDWRGKLEAFIRSFIERQYWLTKVKGSLVSDDGAAFHTPSNSELLIGDEMKNVAQAANAYYLDHSTYPSASNLPNYRNIYSRGVALPVVKRSEFIATDGNDVLRKLADWQAELSVPVPDAQPGSIACFELVATHPHGRVQALAVRACKPKEIPQIIFSIDGAISQQKLVPFVPYEGMQIRWRRIWIDTEEHAAIEGFILHHASLTFCCLVLLAVAASYIFSKLSRDGRQIRRAILIASIMCVAYYAVSPYLP